MEIRSDLPMVRIVKPPPLALTDARRIWLRAQRLDTSVPFGDGPDATRAARSSGTASSSPDGTGGMDGSSTSMAD